MKTLQHTLFATVSGGVNPMPPRTTATTTTTTRPNTITLSGARGVTIGRVTTISPSGVITSVPASQVFPTGSASAASSITQSVFKQPMPPK